MISPSAVVVPVVARIDHSRLLVAISEVERVRGSHRRGPKGERSKYQFTRETWESITSIPFAEAEDDHISNEVAHFYLNKLRYQMIERHIEPTIYLMALAWHRGINGAILRTFQSKEAKSYAVRVENLYLDS